MQFNFASNEGLREAFLFLKRLSLLGKHKISEVAIATQCPSSEVHSSVVSITGITSSSSGRKGRVLQSVVLTRQGKKAGTASHTV